MTAAERVLCATTARWLSASSGVLGALGIGSLVIAALLLMARAPLPGLAAAALLLAPPERLLALRTRFDAGLFADLSLQTGALDLLDEALVSLNLRQQAATPRPLVGRIQGARRLTLQHAGLALLQFSAVAAQLLLAAWEITPR